MTGSQGQTSTGLVPDVSDLEFVYVELSSKCNLRCHFCDTTMRNLYPDIPVERFREIVDQLRPGTRLGLHGLGEPTLHKSLVELIAYAKDRGLYVYFNSNHTVTSDAQMRGFVEHGLDELRISMSAGSRESFESYSGRDLYDELRERSKRMIEIRGERDKPLVRAIFVLTVQSYREFPAVLRVSEDSGFDELQVQTFLNWGKDRLPGEPEEGCALDPAELDRARRLVTEAAASARGIRVILPFSNGDGVSSEIPARRPGACQWPFNATWITAAGQVTPCCNLHDPRQISFGSAFDVPIGEIWLNDAYNDFRREYREGRIDACRTCPINYGAFKSYTYEPNL